MVGRSLIFLIAMGALIPGCYLGDEIFLVLKGDFYQKKY